MQPRYPEITDWSREGRARLVADHRSTLAGMLRYSLERVAEPYGVETLLDAFGFPTLEDATDWCLESFTHREFDLARIPRSWKLFTQPRFWLAQRTGIPGFRRKMAELEALRGRMRHDSEVPPAYAEVASEMPRVEEELEQRRLRERLIATLRLLRDRTCGSLVLWWLRATEELRSGWFDPPVSAVCVEDLSKKSRSLISHDALFRFQCLHRHLIQEGRSSELAHQVVREWLFQPCEDAPPYRRDDTEVARSLPEGAPRQTRVLQQLRREGVAALIDKLIDVAALPTSDEVEMLFDWRLLRHSVTRTTLTAFKLDEGAMPELARRVDCLPEREAARRKP